MRPRFALPLLLLAFAVTASAGNNFSYNSKNTNSQNCQDHFQIHSDEHPEVVYLEESRKLANQPLKLEAARNGGIHVRNWDKPEILVKLCKAGAAADAARARQVAELVVFAEEDGGLTARGPSRSDGHDQRDFTWGAQFLVFVPRGATLDLSAHNGGIALSELDAIVTARTTNGGIALDRTSGKMEVEATNGGISIKNGGGDVKARVQNGGLAIQLGSEWNGAGLDAATHNGGLSVSVPSTFHATLEVSTSQHAGFVCQADVCQRGERTWDDRSRVFRLGSGGALIRASTVNGGVVIKDAKSARMF